MSKVIRIDDESFSRLQGLAEPLIDTPASVINKLLDYYESSSKPKGTDLQVPVNSEPSPQRKKMPNIFLAPANEENINKTIRSSTSLQQIRPFLSAKELEYVSSKSTDPNILHCWAMTEGSRGVFESMKEGDIVLFTIRGSRKFEYYGEVTCKVKNEALGNELWNIVPNRPWELIYFLENIKCISVDKTRLVTELGYRANYAVPGVIRVNEISRDTVLNRYGNFDKFINVVSA